MKVSIPNLSLVVLIGPSGSGKSTFARTHFRPTEVLSSDYCRALISDDENDQSVSKDAFSVLHYIAAKRLSLGKLTVVDATNVQEEARQPLVELARKSHCLPVAIVLNLPARICQERNRERPDRDFGSHVIPQQLSQLRRSLRGLGREGFRYVHVMNSVDDINKVTVERVPLWNDRRHDHGPFDIIGDVHGCGDELEKLLTALSYQPSEIVNDAPIAMPTYRHPEGRRALFVGDLVDRGPRILDTLMLVRNMVAAGTALCVPGNHDVKLLRKLRGKNVRITHGLEKTMAEIDAIDLPEEQKANFCGELADFLDGLISHYVLDEGRLVVAHAGMKEEMQGRGSGGVREFALYGETTGETDEFGLPVRHNWAAEYRGNALVVYGHTPVPEPDWLNRTINIDTGCVFGGKLTALRYPEKEIVSIQAAHTYCEPARPFLTTDQNVALFSAQQLSDDILDADDVLGKRIVSTRLRGNVTVRAENAAAALEVMSRFAVNPKWLIYLPPTMSPSETTTEEHLLEHPRESFSYFRNEGCPKVICEQKHMGSRAVLVLCKDNEAARRRFGIDDDETGVIYTRTGRRFFNDVDLERSFLERIRHAMNAVGFWDEFHTDWVCLDGEIMPWSAKAQELLRFQYAATGSAGRASLPKVVDSLQRVAARLTGDESEVAQQLAASFQARAHNVDRFVEAYRQYCWPIRSLNDLKLAPFHLMATEGRIHTDRTHQWHLEQIKRICEAEPHLLISTPHQIVDLTNGDSEADAVRWWHELTANGGEGMVVKPLDFLFKGRKGLSQPALKCRGREYLRIIYGPDYDQDSNLLRLRKRGLSMKRSLALREFGLGIESLERFIRKEPLRRIHECVFAVLAMESEPVDPRL